jgi:lincosamide nucleotidyltransferase
MQSGYTLAGSNAVFENLVRGEFHFDPASSMERLESFRGVIQFAHLEDTILLDRKGLLTRQILRLSEPVDPHQQQKDALYLQNSFYKSKIPALCLPVG